MGARGMRGGGMTGGGRMTGWGEWRGRGDLVDRPSLFLTRLGWDAYRTRSLWALL